MVRALRHHWPEFLMEAAGLGSFMLAAGAFGTLLFHPDSPVHRAVGDPFSIRLLMGIAMGATAIGIIHSPWGKQSGAHINPAVTFTFWRLGKVPTWDAVFYAAAQFAGGIAGVLVVAALLRGAFAHPAVRYSVTVPGPDGALVAFLAELGISFVLMLVVLEVINTPRLAPRIGPIVGFLVAAYITLESPLSGMSMNPARTFGSALPASQWDALWVYFTAPPIGMLLAAEVYVRTRGASRVLCAKFHHLNDKRCIFRCAYGMAGAVKEAA